MAGTDTKIFNDPIHGSMEFDPLLISIIDTPQFQRLRFINQLGGCYFVFPGAAHNRFEHSLGVAFLAGELVRTLQKQTELDITPEDVLCVQIAGLCHDLGHGPLSHVFDKYVIPAIKPGCKLKHEKLSVSMFRLLFTENDLEKKFSDHGLKRARGDITFIEELIEGPQKGGPNEWLYEGRGRDKAFLYEIVANERNGIDVDKWDYFARDCHNLGMSCSFDHLRCMKFARVIEVKERRQICFKDKEAWNLYEMFHTRYALHKRVYQHPVTRIIETMLVEALTEADKHLKIFPGKDGRKLTMSESLDDMHAYTLLTDSVLEHILISTSPELQTSRDILKQIWKRQLHKCVGESFLKSVPDEIKKSSRPYLEIRKKICEAPPEEQGGTKLDPEDLVFDVVKIDYGKKDKDPMQEVNFYSKKNRDIARKIKKEEVSQLLPEVFEERFIRLYCRVPEKVEMARKYFIAWCKKKGFPYEEPCNRVLETPSTPRKRTGGEDGGSHGDNTKVSRQIEKDF